MGVLIDYPTRPNAAMTAASWKSSREAVERWVVVEGARAGYCGVLVPLPVFVLEEPRVDRIVCEIEFRSCPRPSPPPW